jgi:hypothetical protein
VAIPDALSNVSQSNEDGIHAETGKTFAETQLGIEAAA